MPQIIPIIAGISAALGIGTSAAGLLNPPTPDYSHFQGTAPQPSGTVPPSPAKAGATESSNRNEEALIARNQLPGLEDQTSGSLSPDAYNLLSSEAAGVFGANPATTNPGANFLDIASSAPTGPNDLQAIIERLASLQGGQPAAPSITG